MICNSRILEPQHRDTLVSMNNMARIYFEQGRNNEAENLFLQLAEKSQSVLGKEHPDTLGIMANVALTYGTKGQWNEAKELGVQIMKARKISLGADHPDTLASMMNLASMLWNQGRWKEAEELSVQVTETRKRVLGDEHPFTISVMSNLAATLRDQGLLEEAAAMQKEVLENRKRILGEEHLDTISAMNNLAATFRDQGQLEDTAAMQTEMLENSKRILGDEYLFIIQAEIRTPQLKLNETSLYGGSTANNDESIFTEQTLGQNNVSNSDKEEALTLTPIAELNGNDDDDIRSIISEEEDDLFQALTSNIERRSEIENAIVSLLAANSMLVPVYEKALRLMSKERFANNFGRLLRVFHDGLRGFGRSLETQELAAILKPKVARKRIARRITEKHISHQNSLSEQDLLGIHESGESNLFYLESWLLRILQNNRALVESKYLVPNDETNNEDQRNEEDVYGDEEIRNYGSEIEDEERNEKNHPKHMGTVQFPRLDLAMQTLLEGEPFQTMLVRLKEFLLPTGLLKDILPIPSESFTYDSNGSHGLNRFQGLVEDLAELEWDWWPLPPRLRPLNGKETRLYWRCVSISNFLRHSRLTREDLWNGSLPHLEACTKRHSRGYSENPSRNVPTPTFMWFTLLATTADQPAITCGPAATCFNSSKHCRFPRCGKLSQHDK